MLINLKQIFRHEYEWLKKIYCEFEKQNLVIRYGESTVIEILLNLPVQCIILVTSGSEVDVYNIMSQISMEYTYTVHRHKDTLHFKIPNSHTLVRVSTLEYTALCTKDYYTNFHSYSERRDVTIDAMFITMDGKLIDYHNGYCDLNNSTIKFIPVDNCHVLCAFCKIINYFRLCAEFFDSPIKIDCYSMVIIKENLDALKTMSCPKTWGLLKTLFSAKYWKNALYCMKDINGLLTNLCISINLDHENSEKNTLQKIANCFSEKDQLKPFLHKYHRYDNNDDMHTIIELFERKVN